VTRHARGHETAILRAVRQSLAAWLRYRDGVTRAMGLQPPATVSPQVMIG
jgi:hypothetical protein